MRTRAWFVLGLATMAALPAMILAQQAGYPVTVNDPAMSLRFAAQPDPAESSLEELSEEDVKSLGAVAHVLRWSPGLGLREAFEKDRLGAEFWLPLLLLVLACATGEMYVAQRFSRAK